jgi:HD-GYP domain-containing protein (c-di-GMP phosphodiesterase class II)
MRCVAIDQLRPGDRLGRDISANADGLPLLRTGIRISDSYIQSLQRAGVGSVWIDDGLSEGIEPLEVLEEVTRQRATKSIREAFRDITSALPQPGAAVKPGATAKPGSLSDRAIEQMQEVAEMIVGDVSRNIHSAIALNDLATADGYTLKHSLSVTTLGLAIGLRVMWKYGWIDAHGNRRWDHIDDRLAALGVGLLLHDIGKLAVPTAILHKPGPLTNEEWEAMRAHPMLGVEILRKADAISPLSRAVVRSHHERWNGTGYPEGRRGNDIHQFARIAAAADVFDAVTSDRHYRRGWSQASGYDFIVARGHTDFDIEVVEAFKECVAPYPPGTSVVLSDGSGGLVKEVKLGKVKTPIVRVIQDPSGAPITPFEVDLSKNQTLVIVGGLAVDQMAPPDMEMASPEVVA